MNSATLSDRKQVQGLIDLSIAEENRLMGIWKTAEAINRSDKLHWEQRIKAVVEIRLNLSKLSGALLDVGRIPSL